MSKSGYRNGHLIYPVTVVGPTASSAGGDTYTKAEIDRMLNNITSQQIADGTIKPEDLSPEVQAGLDELGNEEIYATNEDIAKLFEKK